MAYKKCPNCGTGAGGFLDKPVYKCNDCGTLYCRDCNKLKCPVCGSKKNRKDGIIK